MIDFLGKYMVTISLGFFVLIIFYIIAVNIFCRDTKNFKDEEDLNPNIGEGEL